MYKSIIDIIHTDMEIKMEGEIMKAVQRCNIEVDKEELLKALKYDRGQYEKGYQDGLNVDKWIPCEERLPSEENEECLVCKKNGVFMLIKWTKKGWNTYKCFDGTYFTESEIKDVLAWQPLPQPYKKEGAE